MSNLNLKMPNLKETFNTRSFRVGGYSIAATAIVLAIVIIVNVIINALPSSITQIDTTSNQLYTLSDQTEEVLKNLETDVTIYWITQAEAANAAVEVLLDRYESMSKHITVELKDPDVYPTFAQEYTEDTVTNNSFVVKSNTRFRYIDSSELYEYDLSNYYTDGTYSTSFAGESILTSAVSYVTSADIPKIYMLSGHGEANFSEDYENAIVNQNLNTVILTLMSVETIPEDIDCLLIYAPQNDISAEEKEIIMSYLQDGGNLIFISDLEQEYGSRPNLDAIMASYGMSAEKGMIVEGNSSYYALNAPYCILPAIEGHAITQPLIDGNYHVLLPVAQSITISETLRESLSVSPLLTTSDSAFLKAAGYDLETYEKEDGDVDGPFTLAAAATDTLDEGKETRVVWIGSSSITNDEVNAQISGGNQDFFINALSWACDHEDGITIHAKAIDYDNLTINAGTSTMLSILIIGVLPVSYLAVGIVTWARRKRR